LGYAPFALLIGVAVADSSTPWAAWSGVWLVFAGSARLTVAQLVDAGSSVAVAALSAVVINVRLALYSATLSPVWRGTPLLARLGAAATPIDPTWMVSTQVRSPARHAGWGAGGKARRRAGGCAMTMLATMLLVGLGSYVFRVVPLLLADRVRLSPRVEHLLEHAVLAAISALLGTMLVQLSRNPVPVVPAAAPWIGLTAGATAALPRQSMGRVAVIGMAAYLAVLTLAGTIT